MPIRAFMAATALLASVSTGTATEPLTLRLAQREWATLPDMPGEISVAIGDITGGQVEVTVSHLDKTTTSTRQTMKTGDLLAFRHAGRQYRLRLDKLENSLIGEDYATVSVTDAAAPALTEREKIERLIRAVEALDGAKFIRNTNTHMPREAAEHLRKKLDAAGDRVQTASDFIDGVASKSSLSGEPYLVEYPDGRRIPAGDFLRAELARIESGP